MKRVLLVASHLGAGSVNLCYSLAQSRIIEWVQDGIVYDDPIAIDAILACKHKYSNLIGLYVNEVLYNYQVCHKAIYKFCEFIYLIRDPRNAIKILKPEDAVFALNYYIFRLRRIYEMAKEGGIFLTWDNLISGKGMSLINKKLNLPENLEFNQIQPDRQLLDLPMPLLKKAEEAYELCIYRIKNNAQVLKC